MKMRESGVCGRYWHPSHACYESTLEDGTRELSMRVRVGIRGLKRRSAVRERRFLNPVKYGRFAWQLWSHKALRYASPFLWIGALTANVVLINYHVAYLLMFVGQCAIIAAGVAGFILQDRKRDLGLLTKPYYRFSNKSCLTHSSTSIFARRTDGGLDTRPLTEHRCKN